MSCFGFACAVIVLIAVVVEAPALNARPAGNADATIAYHVAVTDPAQETFNVSATMAAVESDSVVFHFPIWAPGAYDIVNFGAYVHDFTARAADGSQLPVRRGDTNTFTVYGRSRSITIAYQVHDIEYHENSTWFAISDIEPDYAFSVGVALFAYPQGYKDVPYSLTVQPPVGWSLAIALDSTASGFAARDYDELVDAPIQMGTFERRDFVLGGKQHTVTLTNIGTADHIPIDQIVSITDSVVNVVSRFFGEMPYDRYLFQFYFDDPRSMRVRSFHGALEHRNSSTYLVSAMESKSSLAAVISHEYLHLWSPKRIHVNSLGPFDYQHAPVTTSLWFAEGLTEYYARVLLLRNGMLNQQSYLSEMERDMKSLYHQKQSMSIAELSRSIAHVSAIKSMTLYSAGPTIGMLLDVAIRLQTANRKSLDDAMRFFNEEYAKKGRTFMDDDIIPIIEQATGADLVDFYRRYIAGSEPLPFDEYLPKIGLRYTSVDVQKLTLGCDLESEQEGWLVTSVMPGGSADSMGIKSGDVITQMLLTDGPFHVMGNPVELADIIVGVPNYVGLIAMRDGHEATYIGRIVAGMRPVWHLSADPNAYPSALSLRQTMFGF